MTTASLPRSVDAVASLVPGEPCLLGEAPVWDPAAGVFFWVDIHGRALCRWAPGASGTSVVPLTETVTCLGLTRTARLVGATPDGCVLISPESGEAERIADLQLDDPDLRTNDGKPSPEGRFFFGTQAADHRPGAGNLYCLEPNGVVRTVLDGVTVSNGLGWSGDGKSMYYVDSGAYRIDVFGYNPATGRLNDRRALVDFSRDEGMPDGLAVDAQDHVWIAMHGGSGVRRYRPDGQLDHEISFPFEYVTSCCFGGADANILFVTSARHRLTERELSKQPLAGRSFAIHLPVAGQPVHRYLQSRALRGAR